MKKSEQLLHLIEHVDDRILEKALSVKSAKRVARKSWMRLGNVAALFVGVIAVSFIIMIAFFLGTNGTNLVPGRESGGILQLPRAHSPAVNLPPGVRYLTLSNPWHTAGREIDMLPVFRSHTAGMDITRQWHLEDIPLNLSEADMDALRQEVTELVDGISAVAGINPYISAQPQPFTIMYTPDLALVLKANINMPLPEGASIAHDATESQREAAVIYLMSRFADVIPMEAPTTLRNAARIFRDYDNMGGHSSVEEHGHRIFDAGGIPEEAILNFNFNWVEFMPADTGGVAAIHIPLMPTPRFESLLEGYYPIITPEEAREMLLDGYFIPGVATSMWPGNTFAEAASVELVYLTNVYNSMIMPVYRFLLGVPWFNPGGSEQILHQIYYVPAVHRDFLEPIARRFTDNMRVTPYDFDMVGWGVIHEGRLYFNEARLYVQDSHFQHRGENIIVFGDPEDEGEQQRFYEHGFYEDYFYQEDHPWEFGPPGPRSIVRFAFTDEYGNEHIYPEGFTREESGYYRDDGRYGGGVWELRRRYLIWPSGYEVRRFGNETVISFELTGDEEYVFTDHGFRFQPGNIHRLYRTPDINDFLEHRDTQNRLHCVHDPELIMTPEEFLLRTCECRWEGIILFLRIQDGRLVTVTEEFRFTF